MADANHIARPDWRTRLLKPCSCDGCDSAAKVRGMCEKHYMRWWRGGGKTASSSFRSLSLEDRFWAKVDKTDGCWNWIAGTSEGYGVIRAGGRQRYAHVVAYELLIGPVPGGLDLDHLCRNRACVRPDHLEPVTRQVNLLRGDTIPAKHAAKTHCPKGHPYAGDNLSFGTTKTGGVFRRCRQCHREAMRQARERSRSVNQSTFLEDEDA